MREMFSSFSGILNQIICTHILFSFNWFSVGVVRSVGNECPPNGRTPAIDCRLSWAIRRDSASRISVICMKTQNLFSLYPIFLFCSLDRKAICSQWNIEVMSSPVKHEREQPSQDFSLFGGNETQVLCMSPNRCVTAARPIVFVLTKTDVT